MALAEVVASGFDPTIPVPAKTSCDVYMVGGLVFELLTAGDLPFHWLSGNRQMLIDRRASAGPVRVPGFQVPAAGLYGKTVLEAAEMDGVGVSWCVRASASPGSEGRLEALKALMTACWAAEEAARPKVVDLLAGVSALLQEEIAEVRSKLQTVTAFLFI